MENEHKTLVTPPQNSVSSCRSATGWELVCPDGGVRHFPYAEKGDAEYDSTLCAEEGCQIFPESYSLEAARPPCVGGPHRVVARENPPRLESNWRGGSAFPAVAEALAAAQRMVQLAGSAAFRHATRLHATRLRDS